MSKMLHKWGSGGSYALLLLLLCMAPGHLMHITSETVGSAQAATSLNGTNQHASRSAGYRGNSARGSRYPLTTTAATNHCDYRDILNNLHDRIGVLASLHENHRDHLEGIDKKLVQFESTSLGRLDTMTAQQMDILKRLDMIDLLARMNRRTLDALHENMKDLSLQRNTRQAHNLRQGHSQIPTDDSLSEAQRFNALFELLTSTKAAVADIQREVHANLTRLVQTTGNLQRRFNNLHRRQRLGPHAGYLPPQNSPNFYVTAYNQPQDMFTSCAQGAVTVAGILKLQLTQASDPFYVRCDDSAYGGGWTLIMDRFSDDINFQRGWEEYKKGFGNLAADFFIGLEKLHALTASSVHELLIAMEDFDGVQRYARYSAFAIGAEKEDYALTLLGAYSGDAGDALTYHAGSKFSTFDNDNDGCVDCNCAQAHSGAWWYNWCEMSNLFGKYYTTDYNKVPEYTGIYWHHFHGPKYSLKSVRMMIRPLAFEQDSRRRRRDVSHLH